MKTIGLVGGITWESTLEYYRIINNEVQQKLGGYHSAKIVLASMDFAEIEEAQHLGDWDKVANLLIAASKQVENAGADFLLICTNTLHKVAKEVESSISIPLLHIGEATATAAREEGIKKAALLGTTFTMEEDFLKKKFTEKNIDIIVPTPSERKVINDVIFKELCFGIKSKQAKEEYLDVISKLEKIGAEAVILACTEIAFLIKQDDLEIKLIDTVNEHAKTAIKMALQEN